MSTTNNATLLVVGRIISCVKTLSTTLVTFYSIVHDDASIEEIKAHIVDLGHRDVAITDHDYHTAQAFADNLPNIRVNPARGRMGVGRETDVEGNWNAWEAERQEQSGGRPN